MASRSMASGAEWGAMVLTEPQAGSDLAQIKGKAELQEDGTCRIEISRADAPALEGATA